MAFLHPFETGLTGRESDWAFVGVPAWTERAGGIICPPVWSDPAFDPDPAQVPNSYAHELAREDFAFLDTPPLDDTDVSVDFQCPYGAVLNGGVVFRAVDSRSFYVVDLIELGRKAQAYEVTLWVQEASGYRRLLARGLAPHSVIPDRIVQGGARSRAEWDHSSPDWLRLRVQATGSFIRVSADDRILFDLRDDTYAAGRLGLAARGAVAFRRLAAAGLPPRDPPAETAAWIPHRGELPRFLRPGHPQPVGFNAYPVVCRHPGGATALAWAHDASRGRATDGGTDPAVVLTRSADEGRTWSSPQVLFSRPGSHCAPTSLFAHRDGSLTALVAWAADPASPALCLVLRSDDGGGTWRDRGELQVGGHPLSHLPFVGLYSPMQRLADGTVVMTAYEADDSAGHDNAHRRDRALLLRSADDGRTWGEPTFFDAANFDHNECMVAEVSPGHLVAFMRTLRATHMWHSSSRDGGRTWSPLAESDISAECPCLLRHSSGALILGSRGAGTFVRLSVDGGQTWGTTWRISPASAMMGMVEMADGRVLVVMHEGYRVPGAIRGQFFRLADHGLVAADGDV